MRTNIQDNKANKLFATLFFFTLLGFEQANAETFYVSSSGSDSNTGTSLSKPVKTIKNALGKAWNDGDIVYVMNGTYVETVSIWQSGITLSAYPDNSPVIDGQSTLPGKDWGALIKVWGDNNLVSGFEVKNSNIKGDFLGGKGVEVFGHHNTIAKMNVHHIWEHGIMAHGDHSIVEDSTIWQAALGNSFDNENRTAGWATGLSAARNKSSSALIPGITSAAILRRNTVYNNWGEGISCFEADHCLIEDNVSYDNWTANLYLSDATNSLVQRNLAYVSSAPALPIRNNSFIGILLADEVATAPRSANNEIINNLVYNANFSAFTWSGVSNAGLQNALIANNTIVDGEFSVGGIEDNAVNKNSLIANNIILGEGSYISDENGLTFSSNNWSDAPAFAESVTDSVGNPQIARVGSTAPGSMSADYFRILKGSSAINAAATLTMVSNDYFNDKRDTAPDIGAHEFQQADNSVDTTAPSAPSELIALVNASVSVDLGWDASTDNVAVAGYIIYRDGAEIGESSTTRFTDTSVNENASYSYMIEAYDEEGNISASSDTATVSIPQVMEAVSISSFSVTDRTANSAIISWTTNVPTAGVVSFGLKEYKLYSQVSVDELSTQHSVQITGLMRRTKYNFQINAYNESGSDLSVISSFRTAFR